MNVKFVITLLCLVLLGVSYAEFVCMEIEGIEDSDCKDYADGFPSSACVDNTYNSGDAVTACSADNKDLYIDTCPKKHDEEMFCSTFKCSYLVACESDDDCASLNVKKVVKAEEELPCFNCCLECFDEEECTSRVEQGT